MDDSASDVVAKALVAGTVCAFVSAFLNPLDVTKIRMQNQSSCSNGLKYRGMISGCICILREEGLAGWTKGLHASMVREVTYSSVRMGAYEPIRSILSNISEEKSSYSRERSNSNESNCRQQSTTSAYVKFTAALISGGVGSAMANPLDLVKTRLQASLPGEKQLYSSIYDAFRSIYRLEGLQGLYKGWMITSSRAAILTSAQLGSYDTIKNNIMIDFFGIKEGFWLHLSASMASGLITTTAANPGEWLSHSQLEIFTFLTRVYSDCSMFYVLYYGPIQFIVMTNTKGNCIVLLLISHHFIFVCHLTQMFFYLNTW